MWDFECNFLLNCNQSDTKLFIFRTYMPVALHFSLIHKEATLWQPCLFVDILWSTACVQIFRFHKTMGL